MADPPLVIAYPPIKLIIKQEMSDEHQEVNSVEEENWTLQLSKDSSAVIAYPPINCIIKPEIPEEHQEVNTAEEENGKLQTPKDSVTTTGNATSASSLMLANAFLSSEDSGESNEHLEAAPNQFRRDLETAMASEREESQQDSEMGSEEEGSEYYKGSEKSEHSSLEDLSESDNSLSAGTTDVPSKEPTRQVQKAASHRKKREDGSDHAAPKKGRFKCSKCEKSYKQKGSLTFHFKYECSVKHQFPCTKCDRQYKQKQSLRKHLMAIHHVDRKQLEKHGAGLREYQILPFKCTKCDIYFKQKRLLDHHMKEECGLTFPCTLCKQIYTKRASLRSHLLSVHKIASCKLYKCGTGFKDRPINTYKCDRCGRTYTLKKNLVRHLTVECGVEPSLPCPQCNCRYKHKSSLKTHLIEIHNVEHSQLAAFGLGPVVRPENKFKCDRCGNSYKLKHHLKRHLAGKCAESNHI